MAGDVKVTSPFGSTVRLSGDTADAVAAYGYEAEKTTTRKSSTSSTSKSSDK